MLRVTNSPLLRYGIAILAVALALLLLRLLAPPLGPHPAPPLLLAVAAGAWYGGRGPALLAAILSTLAFSYISLPPVYSLAVGDADTLRLSMFVMVALLIGLLCAARKRAEDALRESEELHRITLGSISDVILITDEAGALTYIGPNVEMIFGHSPQEIRGFGNIARLLGDPLFNFHELDDWQEIQHIEREVTDKTGARRIVLVNVKRVSIRGGTKLYTCREITARKQAEEMLQGLLEAAPDAVLGINCNGCIALVNAQTEKMFGYHRDELLGRPTEVLLPDCFWELPALDGPSDVSPAGSVLEPLARRKDGGRFPAEVNFSPLEAEAGVFITTTIRDATERKRAEDECAQLIRGQAAHAEAEAANRAKDEFLAMVSHELRGPLNAMLGWSRLLRTGTLDGATVERALETIERNARSQARLIEDLMDVSRIVAGKLRLEIRPANLASVIEAAVNAVSPEAEARAIQLQVRLDPAASLTSGDPHRLEQVVWNLLSNAVKFTPQGGRAEVRLEQSDSALLLTVSDTGKGISAEFLPHVFERFRQDDSARASAHKGLGLGLAIVRHLVGLHGGTVNAESCGNGQGATFRVTLPQSPEEAALAPARGTDAAPRLCRAQGAAPISPAEAGAL